MADQEHDGQRDRRSFWDPQENYRKTTSPEKDTNGKGDRVLV
jgi:hypothetical protein